MKKNGFTTVELIASFALTMVITVFLFEVLLEVKDIFVDTSIRTGIQEKMGIISKNINNVVSTDDTYSVSCSKSGKTGTCKINNSTTIQFIQSDNVSENKIIINGQKFTLPDGVKITEQVLNTHCEEKFMGYKNCYLSVGLYLDSDNLSKVYKYNTIYYYTA